MKQARLSFLLGMAAIVFVLPLSVYGADPSVKDILSASDRARGNIEGIVWDISITTNEDGALETRGLNVKVKGGNTLARYTSPPAISDRMVLMKDRNMWFIRSGLQKPVSISPRQKLMGDAANGDIASTNYAEDYTGSLTGEEAVKGEACHVLDLKAAARNVTYDRIRYWVSKERLVGVKAEFYTISGKLFKTAAFQYNNRVTTAQGKELPFVSELVIHDAIRPDMVTTLRYSNIKVQSIPDSTFNLNVLVR